ncbi:MAG: hypothetical protein ABIT70_10830 [Sulfuriferula sp.]
MFGKTYRFVVQNSTGVALAATDSIVITGIRKNFSSSGVLTFEVVSPASTVVTGGASLASAGFLLGATQDNTAAGTQWLEGDFHITASINTATPNGNLNIYYQTSEDGGATWPDNGRGILVGSLAFTAVGTENDGFSFLG